MDGQVLLESSEQGLALDRFSGACYKVGMKMCSKTDMCNPRPAELFGAARLVLFMILKWYFKCIVFFNFCDTHFTIIHEQKNVTIFKYLGTIDHEANATFRAISNCRATTQIQLFVM